MRSTPSVNRLCDLTQVVRNKEELCSLMESGAHALGYDHYSISVYARNAKEIALTSVPTELTNTIVNSTYWSTTPLPDVCARQVAGFFWSDLRAARLLTKQQRRLYASVTEAGLGDGYTVPANIPGEDPCAFSFIAAGKRRARRDSRAEAQTFASLAFDAWRRLERASMRDAAARTLSKRQVECLVLAARGKSDWEIGKVLGISKDTAHKHIQSVMKRLQVTSRTQMVVSALNLSIMSYSDVLCR